MGDSQAANIRIKVFFLLKSIILYTVQVAVVEKEGQEKHRRQYLRLVLRFKIYI